MAARGHGHKDHRQCHGHLPPREARGKRLCLDRGSQPASTNRAIARRTRRELQESLHVWLGAAVSSPSKTEEPFNIGEGQVLPHGPTQKQVLPQLLQINPGARRGGPGNLFAFGTTQPLGSPTLGEAATVPSDTSHCSVTVRDLEGGETLYKIKKHVKMGEIFTAHANRRSTILYSLRFRLDRQRVYEDQMPISLNLDREQQDRLCSRSGSVFGALAGGP